MLSINSQEFDDPHEFDNIVETIDEDFEPVYLSTSAECLLLAMYRHGHTKKEFAECWNISNVTVSLWFKHMNVPERHTKSVMLYCQHVKVFLK